MLKKTLCSKELGEEFNVDITFYDTDLDLYFKKELFLGYFFFIYLFAAQYNLTMK
ncbi:hypothetical protein AA0X95_20310 [Bacillus sp. 1P10SD]|uniref:hypothetical protein n=1 Tax=Bacillus sp. 1P10SD TaxID=3132265 RepID=UPI0039A6A6BF